ncbi:hypothetical protein RJ639_041534 [Escallonia herrerae]|uniref:DUF1664 domain-containing protein n=1 Tax=Escallonia herrerae TaxID=1293975 RepID=A0AA89B6T5_9ASTE|nr:hypothetical protein RJ639_041534 [Escallonia herrerae]
MAMQVGISFSRIILLAGAGYTGTILLKNGKLSDLLSELQSLLNKSESKEDSADGEGVSEAVAAQIRRLALEVRQLASRQQIIYGPSGQYGNMTNLIIPAAALGTLGYGYMWWKGLSFSDLMYVTKRNMASAVSNLTKHLEHVSDALAATKKHLTQRIENLDGKMDEQVEISKLIRNEVTDVRGDLSNIGYDLDELQRMVNGLDFANAGVLWLVNFANGNKMPEPLQEQFKLVGKSRAFLTSSEQGFKGLKGIVGVLEAADSNGSKTDDTAQDSSYKLDNQPRNLTRHTSLKC